MTEGEMVGWHHRLDEHEFEKTPWVGDGQGRLVCCSPWGHKESDMTEQLSLHSKQGLWHHVPTKTTAGRAPVPMAGHY